MKIGFHDLRSLFLILAVAFSGCERESIYDTDFFGFKYIKGKWKLLYITDAINTSSSKTFLSDNYEIEFCKLDRMNEFKNSNKENKLRLLFCHDFENVVPYGNTEFYLQTSFHESFQMYMLNSPATGDTLYVDGMYPIKNDPNTPTTRTYGVYLREK